MRFVKKIRIFFSNNVYAVFLESFRISSLLRNNKYKSSCLCSSIRLVLREIFYYPRVNRQRNVAIASFVPIPRLPSPSNGKSKRVVNIYNVRNC